MKLNGCLIDISTQIPPTLDPAITLSQKYDRNKYIPVASGRIIRSHVTKSTVRVISLVKKVKNKYPSSMKDHVCSFPCLAQI